MIEWRNDLSALDPKDYPVFPGFNGEGISTVIRDEDGKPAARYGVAILTLIGGITLEEYAESWLDDPIELRDGAKALAEGMTGIIGFIGGLWVREDLRGSDFSRWCTQHLPTLAMQQCDREFKPAWYWFMVEKPRIGHAAAPDAMVEGARWQGKDRWLGMMGRLNVLRRSAPPSMPPIPLPAYQH